MRASTSRLPRPPSRESLGASGGSRTSLGGDASALGSGLHRRNSQTGLGMSASGPRIAATSRLANTQPTYDFLSGGGSGGAGSGGGAAVARRDRSTSPPAHHQQSKRLSVGQSLRMSVRGTASAAPDIANEDLRAKIKTLQYEVDALKQERDMASIRHEKELRDAQAQAEADFRKAQASENSNHVATHKYESVVVEFKAFRDESTTHKAQLEKKLRVAESQARELRDEVDEVQAELASTSRRATHDARERDARETKLAQSVESMRAELSARTSELSAVQAQLSTRSDEFAALERELTDLKSAGAAADKEEVVTLRRELGEQVAHIRTLEGAAREQGSELRKLRASSRAIAIVEEEKRTLEVKVKRMDELERELGEAKFQRQILQDEKMAWKAYLEQHRSSVDQSGDGEGQEQKQEEFDSPEAMAKALMAERLEKADLKDRLGKIMPEIREKEGGLRLLEEKKTKLEEEVRRLRSTASSSSSTGAGGGGESRARSRLERQKNLALKEVEYLRAQLRTFEAEEDVTGDVDVGKLPRSETEELARQRIIELEDLVANYRNEVETLQKDIQESSTSSAAAATSESAAPQSLKRPADQEAEQLRDSERVGELSRKNRALQAELASQATASSVLTVELAATKTQLAALNDRAAQTRILALRNNPTDDFERIKLNAIKALREENRDLHEALEAASSKSASRSTRSTSTAATTVAASAPKTVPASFFEAARTEITDLTAQLADRDKSTLRLKQVWSRKSLEFREAVAALLGWKMDFMPNGRFRMTSLFYDSAGSPDGPGGGGAGDSGEGSLIFNGDTGMMKIGGGGPDSEFGREIRPLIRFWVEERKEIPAFLAACTLEFYERTTRAQRV